MKQVLLIDAMPSLRDLMKDKLKSLAIQIETAIGRRDAFPKLLSLMPDLIILDVAEDIFDLQEFLDKKAEDINVKGIPIIALGPAVDKNMLQELASYNIMKYFAKPVKMDLFFGTLSSIFKAKIPQDTVFSRVDLHTNGNIIFIEIAYGLNIDKLGLLKYRIGELLQGDMIESPKVILMISGVSFCFVDTPNIEMLLDFITKEKRIHNQNVKILTKDPFLAELVEGHIAYEGVTVTDYLPSVVNDLIDAGNGSDIGMQMTQKILLCDESTKKSTVDLRFSFEVFGQTKKRTTIAIVDSDAKTQQYLEKVFAQKDYECAVFGCAKDFFSSRHSFDLLIMDLFLPDMSGLDFLKRLGQLKGFCPVLIYSQIVQKQAIFQAMKLGAKGYLTKPQQPASLIQKARQLMGI